MPAGAPPQYQIYARPAFDPLPGNTRPFPAEVFRFAPRLEMFACADEIEPITFAVYATKALTNASVKVVGPFLSESKKVSLPNSAIQVHVVKRLGGDTAAAAAATTVSPELLVKDDREALSGSAPAVRLTGDPTTDIPAGTSKKFWITVNIPKRQPVSTYTGNLVFSAPGVRATPITLVVDVLPMELKTAFTQYGIDFRSRLSSEGAPATPGQSVVSPEVFATQLADIRDHGFKLVTLHDSLPALENSVKLYAEAQMSQVGPVVVQSPVRSKGDVQDIEKLRASLNLNREFQFFYGLPEETLSSGDAAGEYARRVREANRNALTVAPIASQSVYATLGNALDVPNYAVSSDVAQNLLSTGRRTTSNRDWWSWNIGQEKPVMNRLYAGFLLYKTGLNSSPLYGAFPGPYQFVPDGGGDPFDPASQMAVYPAQNGVINTVQWEATREGVDDIRYIGALKAVARQIRDDEKLKVMSAVKTAVDGAETFLRTSISKNLVALPSVEHQRIRRGLADQTLKLLTIVRTRGARIPR